MGIIKNCTLCGKEFEAVGPNRNKQKFCSKVCKKKMDGKKFVQKDKHQRLQKLEESGSYITCAICGEKLEMITPSHLKQHSISVEEYKIKYPEAKLLRSENCNVISNRQQGANNSFLKKNPEGFSNLTKEDRSKKFGSQKEKHPLWGTTMKEESRLQMIEKNSITHAERFLNKKVKVMNSGFFKTGVFYSSINKKSLSYRSSYELKAYELLEEIRDLIHSFSVEETKIPYMFEGAVHNYIPDILVIYKSGKKQIIEIKPVNLLTVEKVIVKGKAGLLYCKQNNITYSLWTEAELDLPKRRKHLDQVSTFWKRINA